MYKFIMITVVTVLTIFAFSPQANAGHGCGRRHKVTTAKPAPEKAVEPAPETAVKPAPEKSARAPGEARTYRRYSSEPSSGTYTAPRRRASRTPAYLLQKTDPRKYGS